MKEYCEVRCEFAKAARRRRSGDRVGELVVVLILCIMSLDLRRENKVSQISAIC
jgi:hypothetical protein